MLLSIGATGFAVSFVHSILPTHWLPFVLAARAQKWSRAKKEALIRGDWGALPGLAKRRVGSAR